MLFVPWGSHLVIIMPDLHEDFILLKNSCVIDDANQRAGLRNQNSSSPLKSLPSTELHRVQRATEQRFSQAVPARGQRDLKRSPHRPDFQHSVLLEFPYNLGVSLNSLRFDLVFNAIDSYLLLGFSLLVNEVLFRHAQAVQQSDYLSVEVALTVGSGSDYVQTQVF